MAVTSSTSRAGTRSGLCASCSLLVRRRRVVVLGQRLRGGERGVRAQFGLRRLGSRLFRLCSGQIAFCPRLLDLALGLVNCRLGFRHALLGLGDGLLGLGYVLVVGVVPVGSRRIRPGAPASRTYPPAAGPVAGALREGEGGGHGTRRHRSVRIWPA